MEQLLACFDLEGPLSPQDNAYEVMSLAKNGRRLFEILSRYDDVLALENRQGYEAGDTLSLIVPFLLLHGIKEEDIVKVSNKAKIVSGAAHLMSMLGADGWRVCIISTSYEQHARNIGAKLGVSRANIFCTKLELRRGISGKLRDVIKRTEKDVLGTKDEGEIVERLDRFYYGELPGVGYDVFERVRVVGGGRKTEAMLQAAEKNEIPLGRTMAVGDSITDFKMLDKVRECGGLAVAFNANAYAVPHASVALAATDMRFLYILADAFARGGTEAVLQTAEKWEKITGSTPTPTLPFYIHNLEGASEGEIDKVVDIHKKFRKLVRGEAAKLG